MDSEDSRDSSWTQPACRDLSWTTTPEFSDGPDFSGCSSFLSEHNNELSAQTSWTHSFLLTEPHEDIGRTELLQGEAKQENILSSTLKPLLENVFSEATKTMILSELLRPAVLEAGRARQNRDQLDRTFQLHMSSLKALLLKLGFGQSLDEVESYLISSDRACLLSELEILKTKLVDFQRTVCTLLHSLHLARLEVSTKLEQSLVPSTLEDQTQQLQVDSSQHTVHSLQEDLCVSDASVQSLQEDLHLSKANVQSMQEELRVSKWQVQLLQKELCVAEGNVQSLQKELCVSKGNVQSLQKELCVSKGNVQSLQEALSVSEGNVQSLQEALSVSEGKIQSLQEDLRVSEGNVQSLWEDFCVSEDNAQSFIKALSVSEGKVQSLQEALSVFGSNVLSLQEDFRVSQGNVQSMQEALSFSEGNVQSLQKDLCVSEGNVQSLQEALSVSEGKTQLLQKELRVSEDKVQSLQKELSVSDGKVQSLQEELSVSEGNVQSLRENLCVSEENIQALQKDLCVSEGNVQSLREALSFSEENIQSLQNELCVSKDNTQSLRKALSVSEGKVRSLQGDLHVSEASVQSVQEKLYVSEGKVQSLKEDLCVSEISIQLLNQKYHHSEGMLQPLKKELKNQKESAQVLKTTLQAVEDKSQFLLQNMHASEELTCSLQQKLSGIEEQVHVLQKALMEREGVDVLKQQEEAASVKYKNMMRKVTKIFKSCNKKLQNSVNELQRKLVLARESLEKAKAEHCAEAQQLQNALDKAREQAELKERDLYAEIVALKSKLLEKSMSMNAELEKSVKYEKGLREVIKDLRLALKTQKEEGNTTLDCPIQRQQNRAGAEVQSHLEPNVHQCNLTALSGAGEQGAGELKKKAEKPESSRVSFHTCPAPTDTPISTENSKLSSFITYSGEKHPLYLFQRRVLPMYCPLGNQSSETTASPRLESTRDCFATEINTGSLLSVQRRLRNLQSGLWPPLISMRR